MCNFHPQTKIPNKTTGDPSSPGHCEVAWPQSLAQRGGTGRGAGETTKTAMMKKLWMDDMSHVFLFFASQNFEEVDFFCELLLHFIFVGIYN